MKSRRNYFADNKGAAAIEFALLSSLVFLMTLFILSVGLMLYINQALDYATAKVARTVMTGQAQKSSTTQAAFQTSLCGYLPATISCSNVIVNLYVVRQSAASVTSPSQYYNYVNSSTTGLVIPALSSANASYQLGAQGDYQYLQVIYPITFLPSAFTNMLAGSVTYNGSPAYLALSTAAFRNEQY